MRFMKMTGAGNDFIAVNNAAGALDGVLTRSSIARMCRRGLSIGADGLLELRSASDPHSGADYRMIYYNSDGGRASMCGNGGRCMARFAMMEGVAGSSQVFESDAGLHRAVILDSCGVRLWMTDPVMIEPELQIHLPGADHDPFHGVLVDTGVPHLVIFRENIGDGVFERAAASLRRHAATGRDGANVDFVELDGRSSILMRTWERGVEGETLACGTGAVAAVFAGVRLGLLDSPCRIVPTGGVPLSAGRDDDGWWLEGEARAVYSGDTVEP